MNPKQLWASKRFWTGVIALITGLSLVFTGEKSWTDSISEIAVVIIGLVQTVLGIGTNGTVFIGSRALTLK